MDLKYIIKIQALWRGYMSRKGKIVDCSCCGYPMTITPTQSTETLVGVFYRCSWCQYPPEYDKHDRADLGPCPCQDCCGKEQTEEEEPYIPCCMCGSNCYGWDYEQWRFCSRRCMVGWGRD